MAHTTYHRSGDTQAVYRSLVISLFSENYTILAGAIASGTAIAMTAHYVGSLLLWVIAALTIVVGVARFMLGRTFNKIDDPKSLTTQQIAKWDFRFSVGAIACTSLLGAWCLVAALPGDPFPRFISVVVTFANIVGICTRSSALPRLVTWQLVTMVSPMVLGLYVTGDEYAILGVLLIPFMFSLHRIAAGQREILLENIAQRQKAEQLATQMHTALENVPQGIVMFDADGHLEVSNAHVQKMAGRSARSLEGATTERMLTLMQQSSGAEKADVEEIRTWLTKSTERTIAHTMNLGIDQRRIVRFRASRMDNGGFIGTFEDVTREVAAENRIQHMTRYDRLTGLINRSYLPLVLEETIQQREEGEHTVGLLVGVQKFKKINDMMGHQIADLLLCEVSERLSQTLPSNAVIGRFSNDEFMIAWNGDRDRDLAEHTADLVEEALNKTMTLGGRSVTVSCKIGVSVATEFTTSGSLIKEAGLALAAAEACEFRNWLVFDDTIGKQLEMKQLIEDGLRQAIDEGAFELNYQPIVDLKNKRVAVCEALVRWNHPTLGFVPPPVFLPIVEELNLMDELGAWVLRTACKTCASWEGQTGVAVNLSAAQFRSHQLVDLVKTVLAETKLDARRLELEVTETLMLHDVDEAIRQLHALKKLGVRISLDDFGTGYSSLSYMNKLPLDKVKIDRSFVTGLMNDLKAQTLITGISALGHGLDLTVVVEGVETSMELRRLMKHAQVDQIQGYLFSKPLNSQAADVLFKPGSAVMKDMLAHIPDKIKLAA
ncbi:MAG: EAL domain-containing protein [Pseudomonadota bacterium]